MNPSQEAIDLHTKARLEVEKERRDATWMIWRDKYAVGYGWFRLWRRGPGVAWKPVDSPMLFSERNGYEISWRRVWASMEVSKDVTSDRTRRKKDRTAASIRRVIENRLLEEEKRSLAAHQSDAERIEGQIDDADRIARSHRREGKRGGRRCLKIEGLIASEADFLNT